MKSAADRPTFAQRGFRKEGRVWDQRVSSSLQPELRVHVGPEGAKTVPSTRPRILLTDTDRRPYAARLALVMASMGCDVFAVCSSYGHPLLKTAAVRKTFAYSPLRPLESLTRALTEVMPDLVVPCDDRGVRHLHDLYERTSRAHGTEHPIALIIERSLGAPESYATVSCRFDLLQIAQQEGLRVPHTEAVRSSADLRAFAAREPFPWVLKADESWGGRGVRVVSSSDQMDASYQEVSRPFRLPRVLKRMTVNRDPFWLQPWWKGHQPNVVAQAFAPGRPANCAVFCWEGAVLGGIAVEVVSTAGDTGPATIVRVVDNPEMMQCAERLAKRLRLSGFFGLDFMIADNGCAYLIEMNPRATPLCHLQLGAGRDMISALWSELAQQPARGAISVTDKETIAYFPQSLHAQSELLKTSYQDVPHEEPALLEELMQPWPERSFLFRFANWVQEIKDRSARGSGED